MHFCTWNEDGMLDSRIGRRAFLGRSAGGIGLLALAHLLAEERSLGQPPADPLAPRVQHHPARARSVICLFQHGGPSQMDLFDPKQELNRRHGTRYQGELEIHFHTQAGNLLGSPYRFARRGQSGIELSELLPWTGRIVDDLTLVRSMTTESVDHEAALRTIHGGKVFPGRPAWGSWLLYGLGAIRQDLPAYIVLADPGGLPVDGVLNWSSGYLPAVYQGTAFQATGTPVPNLVPSPGLAGAPQRNQLDFLNALNRTHQERFGGNTELAGRIRQFELAAQMQSLVPEALDFSSESAETRRLYGLDNVTTAEYGRRCLLARRLVERGVRFVQLFLSGQPWDTHTQNASRLRGLCAMTDQPSAALVLDLKRRGLLDSTIVLWTGEFGRLPISQGSDGRDHNRHAFSLWLAGGGFKRGYAHGQTDDFSYRAVRNVVRVCDLHATLLYALGLDHTRLTYPHEGREDSLTDPDVTNAEVVHALLQ
jgi:hypothetical protein